MRRVIATADIGSNTVHLLVAQVNGNGIKRLRNDSDWLSLGEVVSREGHIPDAKADRLIATLKAYQDYADLSKAEAMYVFATEAMRVAKNHDVVLTRIERETGIKVDLISARREAELSLRGALIDSPRPEPIALIEVGGGSAQVARCALEAIGEEVSLPIGTGKLIAEFGLTQPADRSTLVRLQSKLEKMIEACSGFRPVASIVASGGVARGLVRALHPDGDRDLILEEVDYLASSTARLSVEQISARFNVKYRRAATLLPGSMVFQAFLRFFRKEEMVVSEYGVREGAVLEIAEGNIECQG